MANRIKVKTTSREQLVDITDEVRSLIAKSGVVNGIACLWSMHTTCALTVNEGADPDVRADMTRFMNKLVPRDADFDHAEGNSDSHVKTSLFGPGLTLLVENGEPLLGTWQAVYLAEWDGPRTRTIAAQIIMAAE
jgi:secondary thiamine-phosphate synthase enzyme